VGHDKPDRAGDGRESPKNEGVRVGNHRKVRTLYNDDDWLEVDLPGGRVRISLKPNENGALTVRAQSALLAILPRSSNEVELEPDSS